jgi:hypothetical protein
MGALGIGGIEVQRLLFLEILSASLAMVFIQRHGGVLSSRLTIWAYYKAEAAAIPVDRLDTGGGRFVLCNVWNYQRNNLREGGSRAMPLLLRKFKLPNGMMQEERIEDPDRIARYMKLFEKEDVKKLETGKWVWIEKDEWQLSPD